MMSLVTPFSSRSSERVTADFPGPALGRAVPAPMARGTGPAGRGATVGACTGDQPCLLVFHYRESSSQYKTLCHFFLQVN